jgi:hypothetical protein
MAAIIRVYSIARVATMLGVTEEPLDRIADTVEPEDGLLWAYDSTEDGTRGSRPSASKTFAKCWTIPRSTSADAGLTARVLHRMLTLLARQVAKNVRVYAPPNSWCWRAGLDDCELSHTENSASAKSLAGIVISRPWPRTRVPRTGR